MCDKKEYYTDLINKHDASKASDIVAKLPVIRTPEHQRQKQMKRLMKEERRIRMIESAQLKMNKVIDAIGDGIEVAETTGEILDEATLNVGSVKKILKLRGIIKRYAKCRKDRNSKLRCLTAEAANHITSTAVASAGIVTAKAGLAASIAPTGITQVLGPAAFATGVKLISESHNVGTEAYNAVVKYKKPKKKESRIIIKENAMMQQYIRENNTRRLMKTVSDNIIKHLTIGTDNQTIRLIDKIYVRDELTNKLYQGSIPIKTQLMLYKAKGFHNGILDTQYGSMIVQNQINNYIKMTEEMRRRNTRSRNNQQLLLTDITPINESRANERYNGVNRQYAKGYFNTNNPNGYAHGIDLGNNASLSFSGGGGSKGGGHGWEIGLAAIMFTVTIPIGGGGGACVIL